MPFIKGHGARRKPPAPTAHERAEHEGRVPQVGIPSGPRQTVAPLPSAPAGTPPVYSGPTPPSRTRSNPLSDRYLLQSVSDLLSPGPTAQETAEAALRLGVKPKANPEGPLSQIGNAVSDVGHELSKDVGAAAQAVEKVAKVPQTLPKQRVPSFLGRKTLGTPTVGQIAHAALQGKVRTNARGKLTIPATRQGAQNLQQARQRVAQSGKLTGPLTPGQRVFAEQVAKETGLNPRVIAAQALAEESGGSAASREAEGNHNWLNIGYFDSGPGAITHGGVWSDPRSAAKATSEFLKGQKYGASGGIQNILAAAHAPPAQQISAIGNSGWATNPAYAQSIAGTFQEVGRTPTDPKAIAALKQAQANAQSLGISPQAQQQGAAKYGPPPVQVLTRFNAAKQAANELEALHLPYVWGGGHNAGAVQVGSGLDCSGTVSFVLQKMGVKLPGGVVSGEMGRYLEPGPGAVTVFYNPEHTFMKIGNKYFGTSESNRGGGAGFIPTSYEGPEASSGKYQVGHVPGLGQKVALQMGIDTSEAAAPTSGGGIVYGPGGATATVTSGTTKQKPGFSSAPILASIATPGAASAPLPAAFQQFQQGAAAPEEAPAELGGLIESLLKRKRL